MFIPKSKPELGLIMNALLLFVVFFSTQNLLASCTRPSADKVIELPGVNFRVRFEHYSGYLDAGDGNHFHYWFFESQNNPSTDPLILFLNGGPGCSSLVALFTECGPFRIMPGGKKIMEHPYSFNKIANIVFLESPAGTGFSYNTGGWNLSDDNSAQSHYHAMISFYEKYPEFTNRTFYLFGQSYAAVYVITLARVIQNRENEFPGKLTGMVIGNGVLNWPLLVNGRFYYNYYHGLLEENEWRNVIDQCCKGQSNADWKCDLFRYQRDNTSKCYPLVKHALEVGEQGRDPYNIHFECYRGSSDYPDDEECGVPFGNITMHYLDQENVRKAMHVDVERFRQYSFEACSASVKGNYTQQYPDSTENVKALLASKKLKILIYNGDFDSVCNFIGTQWFVDQLGVKNISARTPLLYSGITQSNVGYQQNYETGLDFVIIRGTGHYVPADRPRETMQLIMNFLSDKRNYSEPVHVDVRPAPLISGENNSNRTLQSNASYVGRVLSG